VQFRLSDQDSVVLPLIEPQYYQMEKSAGFWDGFSEDTAFESD
jgi:hypothetical protein